MRVNLRRHGLIFTFARRFVQVASEAGSGGDERGDAGAGGDSREQHGVDDAERAPESGIYAPAERRETPISASSESVIKATSKWQ